MKKTFILLTGYFIISFGCTKSSVTENNSISTDEENIQSVRRCAAQEVLTEQLKNDPSLASRLNDIEEFTARFVNDPSSFRLVNGVIEIPVVVNVLYNGSAQNISDAQITSQITVLNQDFQALNADYNSTPSVFQSVRSGNTNVRFVLDQIVRKATSKKSWGTNDAMKKSSQGGINPTSPTTKMNMWCCNLSGGILGYAQFPGGSTSTDGVVIDNNAFGTTGSAAAPYNKGRTATHEVGHWMNLRHIWGDATCGSDLVGDTPQHNTYNFGCPSYPHRSTCAGAPIEMTMNYMDYTDDACMYMFTAGQKTRLQAVFASGGARNSFAQP